MMNGKEGEERKLRVEEEKECEGKRERGCYE